MERFGNWFDVFSSLADIARDSDRESDLYEFSVKLAELLGEEHNLEHAWPVEAWPVEVNA